MLLIGEFGVQVGLEGAIIDDEEEIIFFDDGAFVEGGLGDKAADAGGDSGGFGSFEMSGVGVPFDDLFLDGVGDGDGGWKGRRRGLWRLGYFFGRRRGQGGRRRVEREIPGACERFGWRIDADSGTTDIIR